MKYKETCSCGAVMKVSTDDPMEFARAKGQWKAGHETHALDSLSRKRKRLAMEYDRIQAQAKTVRTYPAMVMAYDLQVGDKETRKMLYEATLYPGNGFYWEDPDSPIILSLHPNLMKLPDLEKKASMEAEAKKHDPPKGGSTLSKTAINPAIPPGSMLDGLTKAAVELEEAQFQEARRQMSPRSFISWQRLADKQDEGDNEQGEQSKSKRDKGATPSEKDAARGRVRRDGVGRRRDKRQG